MTGRDLVSASLRLIGAIAPRESLDASEATDGLSALNRMIGSWSTEPLMIHARVREEFALSAGDQTYSMGSGGDFSTTRPTRIIAAGIEDQSGSPMPEYPVEIVTLEQWAEIIQKEIGNSIPTHLYIEGTYPNETLNFYPKPSANLKAVIYSEKPITGISTLDTVVSLPPGYEDALVYNLAVRLAPEYQKSVAVEIAAIASDTKDAIKRMNHKPRYLKCDPAVAGAAGFNLLTGYYR